MKQDYNISEVFFAEPGEVHVALIGLGEDSVNVLSGAAEVVSACLRLVRCPAMRKCPRCNKRPARRSCPALKTTICAVCCARERMIELPCPESCSYLIEARTSSAHKEGELRQKEVADTRDLMLGDREILSVDRLERAIVNVQRGIGGTAYHDITDAEVLEAIENVIKNIETEESGLIYEHRASTPRIAETSARIRVAFDEMSRDIPAESRPRRSELLRALTFERDAVRAHIQRGKQENAPAQDYIRYISLFYPWPEESTRSLIL